MTGHEIEDRPPDPEWFKIATDYLPEEEEVVRLTILQAESVRQGQTRGSLSPYERIRDARASIATGILGRYGIPTDSIEEWQAVGGSTFYFPYAGRTVRLDMSDSQVTVMTWDKSLTSSERDTVWHMYERAGAQDVGLAKMADLDTELLEEHGPYEDPTIGITDRIDADKQDIAQRLHALYVLNGFSHFTLESSYISWALPIAMAAIAMPVAESSRLFGLMDPEGSEDMRVTKPGSFEPYEKRGYWLSEAGEIEQLPRGVSQGPDDPRLAEVIRQLEQARIAAIEEATSMAEPGLVQSALLAVRALLRSPRRK